MKKNYPHLSQRLFIGIILLVIQQTVRAQVPEPAAWSTFINSTQNVSIRDTFRMQTFDGTARDNWKYTASEGTAILEELEEDIDGKKGAHFLKLPPAGYAYFEHYPLNHHKEIAINIRHRGQNIKSRDTLWLKTYRDSENKKIDIYHKGDSRTFILVPENPPGIDLISSVSNSGSNTFYCIDSVYAYGNIPLYTLFSTSGSWNDTTRWSHLPAARHRNALISGHASIDTNMQCNDLHIGDGSVTITENSHSIVNNITLYYTDISLTKADNSLTSSGKLTVNGKVTIKRSFTEKGKWYFISFPFDVYPDGIDTGFELKDETFKGGGNVFYIKTYNGQKRANNSNNKENWETLPASATNSSEPIFRKNKGYMIALDAEATSQTLCFSSKEADIPTDFGKKGTIPVQAFLSQDQAQSQAQNEHSGWYLCGNPLPSTLSLSQIETNPDLDGNIYLYNGSSYTSYPIGSNYTLPPLAAFFVKANTDTEIKISTLNSSTNECLLFEASLPIQQFNTEPSADIQTSQLPLQAINSQIIGDELHLSSVSSPGHIRIIHFSGHVVYSKPVAAGSSTLSLSSLKEGFYIMEIETESQHTKQKFIRK